MEPRRSVALVITVAALFAGACGEREQPRGPGSPESTPAPQSSLPSDAQTTLRGTVQAGVEAGCLVLDAEGQTYLLLGGDPRPRPGAEVVVTGSVDRGVMTICQQGLPFVVTEIRPA
ncbi:MAG: hypothetical protein ACRDSE_04475 [Pseudonocardiaceae bacterium]